MEHLHNTKTILDTPEVQIDICIECKEKLIYKKCRRTGRIDNHKYLIEHKKDFLQKRDKSYDKYYGKK